MVERWVAKLHDNRYFLTVGGLIAIIIAMFVMGGSDVTCGRKVMSPGDSCTTTKNGNKTTRTYAEQRDSDATTRLVVGTAGGIATVIGLVMIGLSLARRGQQPRPAPNAAPVASPPPGQPAASQPYQAQPSVPPVPPQPYQAQPSVPPVPPQSAPPAVEPFTWPDSRQHRPPQP